MAAPMVVPTAALTVVPTVVQIAAPPRHGG
jgi:hypothetical protein